ncbi:MAG: serine/threonine protein kinase [Armatimonadetes bacterium]|nr:serine/threonine protein kinase [Armatimonadota bacterium]MDW8121477.1 serine/threonine-protein kinase [Armatimonadota bacterium]
MQMCPACSWNNFDAAKTCSRCGEPLRNLLGQGEILRGRYRLVRVLGCGGMGAVYLAEDLQSANRLVAVKENFDPSPESASQFELEAQILKDLYHRHLPRVFDFFVVPETGKQYLVMDYISGDDLEQMVSRKGPLSVREAHQILSQVADAVSYLHSQSPPVIHRDIKPSNIKVATDGRAVLVDLGIAKRFQPGKETIGAAAAVTPGYSPPEQYGQGITDQRSDIYSLAATYYFALTGRMPPEAIDRVTRGEQLIPPSQFNRSVPPHLDSAILKAMSLKPDNRYPSVAAFMSAVVGRPSYGPFTHPVPTNRTRQRSYPRSPTPSRAPSVPSFDFFIELLFWLLIASAFIVSFFVGGCRGCIIIPIPLMIIGFLAFKAPWIAVALFVFWLALVRLGNSLRSV